MNRTLGNMIRVIAVTIIMVLSIFLYLEMKQQRSVQSTIDRISRMKLALTSFQFIHHESIPSVSKLSNSDQPLFSWRFKSTLALSGTTAIENPPQWEHAWDSSENKYYALQSPSEFCESGDFATPIYAITGNGTVWDKTKAISLYNVPASTLLMVEVKDSDVHWMAPGDFSIEELKNKTTREAGFGSKKGSQAGFIAGFSDGEALLISYDVPMENILKLATIQGANLDPHKNLIAPCVINQ